MQNYKLIDGKYYAVIYRKTKKSKLEKCVFCGERHTHGIGDGHRIAHCVKAGKSLRGVEVVVGSINGKDIVVSNDDGYFIQTISDLDGK